MRDGHTRPLGCGCNAGAHVHAGGVLVCPLCGHGKAQPSFPFIVVPVGTIKVIISMQ